MRFSATDHALMARALRLAERGAWTTRPNPMVGCVIAHGDEVVGEGYHQRKGGAHAEVFALQAAGERARGATAYVTLEPCAHHGSTGPCAEALVAAGVARVVAAMRDPFPQVDGAGFERLRTAGIAVEHGLMEAQARELNRGFLSRVERRRPWLRVKLATSLDGRSAMASGESRWISGEAARADVQRWRARSGALMTGAGTVLADDPRLTVRLPEDEAAEVLPPLRVVLDPGLATVARGAVRNACIELEGPLGAGKTTFVRHLLRALGVGGRIKSPSYAVVEMHTIPARDTQAATNAAHFDFYRFADAREWEDAGLRDLYAAPGIKLTEWPEKARALLPAPDLRLVIEPTADDARRVVVQALTPLGVELLA